MIIRCPDCTTGFKLPNDQVSEDPIKVRCSKCSHIFRVGLVDSDPILYDEDGERLPDEAQQTRAETEADDKASADQTQEGTGFLSNQGSDGDEGGGEVDESEIALDESGEVDASDTHIGTQAVNHESDGDGPDQTSASPPSDTTGSADESDSSDYNPFPHADSDIGPKKSKAITGNGEESTSDQTAAAVEQPVSEETVEAERAKVDDEAFRETQQIDPDEQIDGEPSSDQQSAGSESYADGGEGEGVSRGQQGQQSQQPQPSQQAQQSQQPAGRQSQQQPQQTAHQQPSHEQATTETQSAQEPELQTGPQQTAAAPSDGSGQDYWDKEPADDEYHDEYFDPETGTRQKKNDPAGEDRGESNGPDATVTSSPGNSPAGGGQTNTANS
ncbi:MAG: zinc-ribbon domain-containing protein, partial [Bradymonadaceae bacterium]